MSNGVAFLLFSEAMGGFYRRNRFKLLSSVIMVANFFRFVALIFLTALSCSSLASFDFVPLLLLNCHFCWLLAEFFFIGCDSFLRRLVAATLSCSAVLIVMIE
ncbi:hypothetical protein Droror1_Dr00022939 [Drosera rotundifolia]